MRAFLAVAVALVISGPASGAQAPETAPGGAFVETDHPMLVAQVTQRSTPPGSLRANVPRATGTGLAGVPMGGGTTVMGLSPGVATLLGIVIVGGIVAIVANDDDEPAAAGSGSGGN